MEKFEVFNRTTGQWESENISIVPGWNLNWVQDKTTDTMQLKVKYKSETAPNWNNGDWCRVLHLENNETRATYKDVVKDKIPLPDFVNKMSVVYNNNLGNNGGFEITCTETLTEQLKITIEYWTVNNRTYTSHKPVVTMEKNTNSAIYLLEENEQYTTDLSPVIIYAVYRYIWLHIPLNHEQFIIGGISLVKNKIAGDWDCQLTLKEPIEIANGISVETRSFTNQVSKVVDGVTYTHDRLTHLSVLETILKTTPANNDLAKSWYSRITILNKDLLENTPFNDETLSEQSLYGILLEKYDSAIGRTPVLYFDMDNETDLPNNLTKETYILDFLRQDGYDKESVELDDLLENHNEYIINKSDENATDGIVSNYDNLSVNTSTYYPSQSFWTVAEIDTNERDVSGYGASADTQGINSKWILRIPHAIKKINKITRFKLGSNLHTASPTVPSDNQSYVYYRYRYDDLEYIYEEKEYNAETDNSKREKAVWFTEGDNKVHINEETRSNLFDIGSATWQMDKINWLYNIEYEPLISARYDLGKDYQTQLNQNDSQVDNVKFGKYIKDYLASMNKADLIITKTINNFNDIVEIGTRVLDTNNEYLITNISIQNRGFDYEVVYQLNENHFRRSDNISASQEIRKNIELSIDATKERKSMLPFECKISLTNINNSIGIKNYIISSLLTDTSNLEFIQTAYLNMKGTYKNRGDYSIKRYCEVVKYVLNNTFCLNMKYFDNAEAGKQKTLDDLTRTDKFDRTYSVFGITNSQLPILYTNYFGEFEQFDVDFQPLKTDITTILDLQDPIIVGDDIGYQKQINLPNTDYNNLNREIELSANYPTYDADLAETSIFTINDINYYKDMLDTFNYTIGFHLDSDNQIILCQAFFNNSILMTNTGAKIYAIKTYTQNMTENDYAITDYLQSSTVTGTLSGNEITIQLSNTLNTTKSVVIVDRDDKPLLIINDFDKIKGNTFDNIKLYC